MHKYCPNELKYDLSVSHPYIYVYVTMSVEIDFNMCYTTYPCCHMCSIDGHYPVLMNAVHIIQSLHDRNLSIPAHFVQYDHHPMIFDDDANPICIYRYMANRMSN